MCPVEINREAEAIAIVSIPRPTEPACLPAPGNRLRRVGTVVELETRVEHRLVFVAGQLPSDFVIRELGIISLARG